MVQTQVKRKKKTCAVYGESAVAGQTCQKWFAKFHVGDLSLEYTPQSGRPVKVDSNHIKTVTENN